MKVNGNVILLTGGTSGLGRSLLNALYYLDNQIITIARSQQDLEDLRQEFPKILIFQCDVGKRSDLLALKSYCVQNNFKVNWLINNAGVEYNYFIDGGKTEIISEEISTNLIGPLTLVSLFIDDLKGSENSAVVNITSGLVILPKVNAAVYAASKAGLHQFTRSLRLQLKSTAVRVFEVLPPLIDTPLTSKSSFKKMSSEKCTIDIIKGLQKDKFEIRIGVVKWVYWLYRINPALGDYLMYKRYLRANKNNIPSESKDNP